MGFRKAWNEGRELGRIRRQREALAPQIENYVKSAARAYSLLHKEYVKNDDSETPNLWRDLIKFEQDFYDVLDNCVSLDLNEDASFLAIIHWRTLAMKIAVERKLRKLDHLPLTISTSGCTEVNRLNRDLRLLSIGYHRYGLEKIEFHECKKFTQDVKNSAFEQAKIIAVDGYLTFRIHEGSPEKTSLTVFTYSLEPKFQIYDVPE